MDPAISSLIDRAGLDRGKVRQIMGRGLEGADDGELFLEYRQAEALTFDNGRLKQASYDTVQGFGLRAVKDEAVGYAHASDLSEAAIARAAEAVRAVKGGHSGTYAEAPARTNRKLYSDENPLGSPAFDAKVKLLELIDAYAREKDPRVRQVTASVAANWQVVEILRADSEIYRDIRPMVRFNVSVIAGDGDRQESGSYGFGGRESFQRFIDHLIVVLFLENLFDCSLGSLQSPACYLGLYRSHRVLHFLIVCELRLLPDALGQGVRLGHYFRFLFFSLFDGCPAERLHLRIKPGKFGLVGTPEVFGFLKQTIGFVHLLFDAVVSVLQEILDRFSREF